MTIRKRPPRRPDDLESLLDAIAAPDLAPERHAQARATLLGAYPHHAEAILRATARAAAARRELEDLRAEIARRREGARLRGVATARGDGHVRVLVAGAERELPLPPDVVLGVGQTVLLDAEGWSVTAAGDYLVGGHTFAFCDRLDDERVLLRSLRDGAPAEARQVGIVAEVVAVAALRPGDRVLGWALEGGNVILVTRRLGGADDADVEPEVGGGRALRREDLVGLDAVIAETELLFLQAPGQAYAGVLSEIASGTVGVCFHGEPGTGKSALARLFVDEVRARGGTALCRTGPCYLSRWVGVGAERLRADLAHLDAAYRRSGVRPLLVIDEVEAIALDRRHAAGVAAGHLEVLDELLAALTRTEARVIAISNLADRILDPALLRSGRLRVLRFPDRLTPEGLATLVRKALAIVPLGADREDADPADLGSHFGEAVSDLVFAPDGPLGELLRVQLADGRLLTFGAAALATPAAVTDGIVRPLVARRVRGDLRAGRTAPSPLRLDDLRAATIAHFMERAALVTRDNVRSTLGSRVPEDQAVARVEHAAAPSPPFQTQGGPA